MPAWAAWAIPLIASVAGGALSSKSKSGFDKTASDRALNQLQHNYIYGTGERFFPGLLPPPPSSQPVPANPKYPNNLPRKAHGGPVETGQDYVVGEEGPEVFKPKQDGMIIPNPATSMGMEGGPPEMGGGMPGGEGGQLDPKLLMLALVIAKALMEAMGGEGGEMMGGGPEGGVPQMGGDPMGGMGGDLPAGPMPPGGAGLPGMVRGGPVRGGQRYLVGEQGQETFAPTPVAPTGTQAPGGVAPTYSNAGEGFTGTVMNNLNNPGQLSPMGYHREQEQANQVGNQLAQSIQGGVTGAGLDPNSPFAQSMQLAGQATAGKMRTEAATKFSLAQDVAKRQDQQAAIQNYLSALQIIFGLQQSRAAAAGGQGFPNAPPIYPYQNIGQGLAQFGAGYADRASGKKSDSDSGDG